MRLPGQVGTREIGGIVRNLSFVTKWGWIASSYARHHFSPIFDIQQQERYAPSSGNKLDILILNTQNRSLFFCPTCVYYQVMHFFEGSFSCWVFRCGDDFDRISKVQIVDLSNCPAKSKTHEYCGPVRRVFSYNAMHLVKMSMITLCQAQIRIGC